MHDPTLGRRRGERGDAVTESVSQALPEWDALLDDVRSRFAAILADQSEELKTYREWERFYERVAPLVTSSSVTVRADQLQQVMQALYNEMIRYGGLEPYLTDPDFEDILCTDYRTLTIGKRGRSEVTDSPFRSEEELIRFLQTKVFSPQNMSFTLSAPQLHTRLSDGSRIAAYMPPASRSAGFSIRRHRVERFESATYLGSGVAPPEFFQELSHWVDTRQNMAISGATGSGKTTLLNFIGTLFPAERIITIEDTPELQLPHDHVLSFYTYAVGDRMVGVTEQLAESLRHSPKRIVVGEVRGPEAFAMLQAMNTGHSGSITTVHANTPSDAIMRLEALAAPANPNMPTWALHDLMGSNLNLVIQMKQVPESSQRAIVEVAQVLHPAKVIDQSILSSALEVSPGKVYLRTLWLWADGGLQKVADAAPVTGQYF